MEQIIIKPHHFMDILKLYGSGINIFVSDEKMGHDSYKVANRILKDRNVQLRLTTAADDICQPCIMCQNQICIDRVNIADYHSKDDYNRTLDKRLLELMNLNTQSTYSALELCRLMLKYHHFIFDVWNEEGQTLNQKRHDLFVLGAQKYIK